MVSMAGIALATAAMVVVMSVFNGFHSLIQQRLSSIDAPVYVLPSQGKYISNASEICAGLDSLPAIRRAAPQIEERALAVYDGRQVAVQLRGVSPELYFLYDSICPIGSPWAEYHPQANSGIISVGVANELQVPVAAEALVKIFVPKRKGRINPANPMAAFRADSIAPSAVSIANQPELDNGLIFMPYARACKLLQKPNSATSIAIYPAASVNEAIAQVRQKYPDEFLVKTLMEMQSGAFQIVNMEKWMTFMLMAFILVIASFNIISSLSLLIIEKEPNAAILQSIGATPAGVRQIYRWEGVLVTIIGSIAGLIVGTLLSIGQEAFGWVKLSGDASQLSVSAYPVEFHFSDLIPVALMSIIIGLIASLIATRK